MTEWTYLNLVNGRILTDEGHEANENWPTFNSWDEANQYLIDEDIRGSLRYRK